MRDVDVVIVGGGPGGLQVAHDLERHGRSYVLLERSSSVGSFFAKFPRHRTLISVNKVHTGYDDDEQQMRFDWNSLLDDAHGDHCLFKHFSDDYFPPADAMVRYLEAFAARFVSSIERECTVRRIAKVDGAFHVEADGDRSFRSRAVVMATGVSKAYRPPIPGLELAELYTTFDTAPHRFENKRVLIIGKGNSAFETADAMMHKAAVIHLASPSSIRFAWNSHFPGHLRAVNNNFLDTYQLKIQNALLDANVRRLQAEPDGRTRVSFEYAHAQGECEDIIYDHVICCAGFAMDVDLFDPSACPAMTLDGRFPALTSQFESATVPGLFFAGTLTQSLDYKRSNSAFVHGFRYNARALVRLLEQRLWGTPLPFLAGPTNAEWLTDRILDRINRSSAHWQQFGTIGDVFVLSAHETRHYEELPVAYVHESSLGREPLYALVTLEFGKHEGEVFAVPRAPRVDSADESFFLHPVIRVFSNGLFVREHHLLENLFGEWTDPLVHRRPLRDFMTNILADAAKTKALLRFTDNAPTGP